MPVFISYSHADKDFAENLAVHLVQAKQNVWIDKWELNAGDSIIAKIEEALEGADAILVILSKDSVKSEWCKKELRSGLIRELEQRAVVVIPIVIDDCEIPLFLREKLHIDFRTNRDASFALLLRSLDRISNPAQSRAEVPDYHIDWSMNVIRDEDDFGIEWNMVGHGENLPYVILTRVTFWPAGSTQSFFRELMTDVRKFVFAAQIMKEVMDYKKEIRLLITSPDPVIKNMIHATDGEKGAVEISITVRRMGLDNGMDTLVDVGGNLHLAINHTLQSTRETDLAT